MVPCCVFSELFPRRRLASPDGPLELPVLTHRQLCEYLVAKDATIDAAYLDVDGKNRVVYRASDAPPSPEHDIAAPVLVGHVPASARARNDAPQDDHAASDDDDDDGSDGDTDDEALPTQDLR